MDLGNDTRPELDIEADVQLPAKVTKLFLGSARYRCVWGGRGSGKTQSMALMSAIYGYKYPINILCAREFQNSLDESSFEEIRKAIESHSFLRNAYDVGRKYIYGPHGNRYYFTGLSRGLNAVKSKASIGLAWVDEAESISDASYQKLFPTVRGDIPEIGFKSEIWLSWNPESIDSPTHKRFRLNTPKNCRIIRLNYTDNPWFPDSLREDMIEDRSRDPDTAAHVWDGELLTRSEAQVFYGKWRVGRFTPKDDWDGPYQGVDFGFSTDPFSAVRVWIDNDRLWVEYAYFKKRLELDDTPEKVNSAIPEFEKYVCRADSAEPKSISYLRRNGIPRMEAVQKWPNSIKEGVRVLRSFKEIIIHERCVEMQQEARLYSHKVDRLTQDILPDIVDANNHGWDAIRYALAPIIKNSAGTGRVSLGK